MYKPKKDRQLQSGSEPATPDTEVAYTALAIKQVGFNTFTMLELQFNSADELINTIESAPKEFHLAVQQQKTRASYVWTGLAKQ